MEKTNIGLNEKDVNQTTNVLNKLLSDEFVLYTKTRNFHWNIKGPHFNDYHKFFEEQYSQIEEKIDDIAERVRILGKTPLASLKEYLENTSLKEVNKVLKDNEMIEQLLNDHETIIRNVRKNIDEINLDQGTEDFLIAIMQDHEKMAWMLRSINKA